MDELISDFLTETNESLVVLDNQLVTLEQNPNDKDLLGSIFRIMHTIKGTCGFLGLPRLESVAHAGENIMDKIRNNEIPASTPNVSMIIEAIDKIKELVAHLEEIGKEAEGDDKDLIARLNKAAEGGATETQKVEAPTPPSPPALTETPPPTAPASSQESDIFTPVPAADTGKLEEAKPAPRSIAAEAKKETPPITEEVKKAAVQKGLEITNNEGHDHEKSAAPGSQASIRVNLDVLENLMQIVSELVLNRNQLLQLDRSIKDNKFTTSIQRLSNITSELQDSVMKTRMQPIKNAWTKFPRLIRDLSVELNKKIKLVMIGEETELDRQLIETIKDPLTHMVRNSCDHGLEVPEDRIKMGKSEIGTVTLKAYHQGGHIIVEIVDDGRGINIERIKKKIIETKLATEESVAMLTDQQAMQYIFKAGFSTADKITSVSGRGVGMDVVKTNIERISGTVELNSALNKGSRFVIKIPLTLAIMPILIVESANERFGIPQISVVEMVRAGGSTEYEIEEINGKKILRLRSNLLPLISLKEILKLDSKPKVSEKSEQVTASKTKVKKKNAFIVVCEVNGCNFGLVVDKIFDTEEIVVKPVAPMLKKIGMYSGNTILGDGQVIMIVDPAGLIKLSNDGNELSIDMNSHSKTPDLSLLKETRSSFLILKEDNEIEKAIPLELVARLEEIDAKDIEFSGGKRVVQYRKGLMYLAELNPKFVYPNEGPLDVVVFIDREKTLGLVVNEILDIVEQNVESNKVLEDSNFSAIIIQNKTMDIININEYFEKIFDLDEEENKPESEKNKHILFIDDSPFFRKFIPPSIIEAGYKVTTIDSAVKASEMLELGSIFNLIITDINMPEMSGTEFIANCKKDQRFSNIPIIALTSNNDEAKMNKLSATEGLEACISKTNHEDLLSVINEVFQKNRGKA